LAFVAWFAVSAGGCAAVAGLDSISEQDCAPNCGTDANVGQDVTTADGPGTDSPIVAHEGGDQSVGNETGSEAAPLPESSTETSTPEGSTGEGGPKDGGTDAPVDAPVDSPPEVGTDAPFDSGCGALNTTANCSACGDKCPATNPASVTGTPACSGPVTGIGATCSYTCAASHLDCNAATAPNTDGCECATPGITTASCCPGEVCPVQHVYDEDIANTFFYDCVAASTYNVTVATDACLAYGGAGNCDSGFFCTSVADGGTVGDMVCSDGAGAPACACWGYDGQLVGKMFVGPGKGMANCECPQPSDPSWK
jgi:hypothetical protein